MTSINMQISWIEGLAAEWHQDSHSDTVIVLGNTLPCRLPPYNRRPQPECFALFTCLWLVKRHMEPPSAEESHVRSGMPLGPFIFTEVKTRISKRTPVNTLAHANRHEHPGIFKMRYLYLIKSNIDDCLKKSTLKPGRWCRRSIQSAHTWHRVV